MTIELVDGHANKPHISGDDLGDFKAGILGNDGYVFNRANKLAATLNGSNSVTIATGSGILPNSGRHFRVTAPETLTITSGTQGQNRNDLCVVRASTSDDGTTVENAQLLILRGTPTSGSASDPATQEGDLVLYRFQLTGVSVAEPIALFDVMVPYNEFRDSISQYSTSETSTGKTWIDGKAIYRKVIQFGAMSGNNRYTKAHGISYDTIVSFNAIARNSTNSYLPLARVGYNSDNQIDASLNGYAYITPDDAIIIGGSQTNYTGATVIIEYTKA